MAALPEDFDPDDPESFARLMASMPEDEFAEFLEGLPDHALHALVRDTASLTAAVPQSVIEQAQELDPRYVVRPHLEYLSERLSEAVADVKRGIDRKLLIAMPPRTGKSETLSKYLPIWLLRQFPSWKVALVSYSPQLANDWSLAIRRLIEEHGAPLGLAVAPDAGAKEDWQTTAGGEVHARSIGQGLTGQGANLLIIDDPFRDSVAASQASVRELVWTKWTNDLQSRLQPPSLTIVVHTRWHDDDLSARLQNPEIDGAVPEDWEVISFPAIAEENDVLGREPGDPLFPPLLPMVREKALAWWEQLKRGMSAYNWAAMYQQSPTPAQGSVFNVDWWCYWTKDPRRVTYDENGNPDGRVILLPDIGQMELLDSWDLSFDDTANSDFVVGQRWGMVGPQRFLLDQRRGRWNFPTTLEVFEEWNSDRTVHRHLVEKKANGAAMIAMMKRKFAGILDINPTRSKEIRAEAVTPEIRSGHVFLPLPIDAPWVAKDGLMDELRDFPTGKHDDQVDALSQALMEMRGPGLAAVSSPGQMVPSRRGYQPGAVRPSGPGSTPVASPLTTARIDRRFGSGPTRR